MRPLFFAFSALTALSATACVKARPPSVPGADAAQRRDLVLSVAAELAQVPAGAKELVLWIPVPRDEEAQVLRQMSPDVPGEATLVVDETQGNSALEVRIPAPPSPVNARVTFHVSRVEARGDGVKAHPHAPRAPKEEPSRWLKDDGLTVVDDRVREIATEIFKDKATSEDKARAAYEYVLANMKYSKEGTGWGTGSTVWACEMKYGNCTDFHALFMSLMRAGRVPARFRIGFNVPKGPGEGPVTGYHCWAEWYSTTASAWVPVDISEAWKAPDRKDYLFGKLDPDRVGMSLGRDVKFPGQQGPALNYFVFPYAEIDGQPVKVETKVTWAERR